MTPSTARSQRVTIFEGPDGGGKSTAAQRYAELTGARYVHLGPFSRVKHGLGRLYADAMLPALLGYQPVVLDRSWLSEPVYGQAYRGGADRLGAEGVAMLNRLALRCGAVVVYALPPFATVRANFLKRKGEEYLDSEAQLQQVYAAYTQQAARGALPSVRYDYTRERSGAWVLPTQLEEHRVPTHLLSVRSAGNLLAPVLLVGEGFGPVKEHDPLWQWSFVSFSATGCSRWLTGQLSRHGVPEGELLWVNADEPRLATLLEQVSPTAIIALGESADQQLTGELARTQAVRGAHYHLTPHPQYWKRFHGKEPYPLLDLLETYR